MEKKIKCPHCNHIVDSSGEVFTVGRILFETDEPALPHKICPNCNSCIGCEKEGEEDKENKGT